MRVKALFSASAACAAVALLGVGAASADPPGNNKRTLWGYEASAGGARILQYQIRPTGGAPLAPRPTCVPTHTAGCAVSDNGRGVAFSSLDANLWNTHVNHQFNGDGFIHKNTPPPACDPVTSIPFGDGPGGTV